MSSNIKCNGATRRDFLQVGLASLGGLTLPQVLRLRAKEASKRGKPTNDTRCILVWLDGGPSHYETFDPKPDAPDGIRGEFIDSAPETARVLDAPEDHEDLDLDDPVPVIALLNRQMAGQPLDPEEVYEVLEPVESVVIGDEELCRKKMQGFADIGLDRLMCMMQIGALPHETVMQSIRRVGEILLPEFAGRERRSESTRPDTAVGSG